MIKKLGISLNGTPGIGDKVQYSSVPENYYYTYGKKIIDVDKAWIYDHNPFVDRESIPDEIYYPWFIENPILEQKAKNNSLKYGLLGMALRKAAVLDLNITIRHPRLYAYEDSETESKKVVVHTNGVSEGGVLNDSVIDQIQKNYKNYKIYQIGGKSDRNTPFIDMRGLGMWETAQFISSAEIYIGVNSGMMSIANSYPKVRKKIILLQYDQEKLKYFYPSAPNYTDWIDFNNELYNAYDVDIGVTMSYKKI